MKTEIETTDYAGVDYACGQGTNQDKATGIRYGVIHSNKVSSEAFDDIATNGDDVDFENYKETIHKSITSALESALGDYFGDDTVKSVVEAAMEQADEDIGENYESGGDCTRFEYESDGYHIQTASDGDMFVLKSPYFTYAQFCSPCAPGACYLTSPLSAPVEANKCYCLGADWFDEYAPLPYPVYSVETGLPVAA